MAKLRIKSELTIEEVQELFAFEMAYEKHSRWNPFERYLSRRCGLHLYKTSYGLYGYYESGRLDRYYEPQSSKTWCKIVVKNGEITCKILHNPYIVIINVLFLFYILQDILRKNWDSLGGALFYMFAGALLFNECFNDEDDIIKEIKRKLVVADDKVE